MPREFTPKVVTGNALLEGDVIYLTADGGWTRDLARAEVLTDEADGRIVSADAGVATGVLTEFLPGPLSSAYSFATGDLIGKSGTTVTVDAQTELAFTLYALDVQNSNKVDDDTDRFIDVKLEFVSDKNGNTGNVMPKPIMAMKSVKKSSSRRLFIKTFIQYRQVVLQTNQV